MTRDEKVELLTKLKDEQTRVADAVANLQEAIWKDDPTCMNIITIDDVVHGSNGRERTFCEEAIDGRPIYSNNRTTVITCKKCLEKMNEMFKRFAGKVSWPERVKKLTDACFPPVGDLYPDVSMGCGVARNTPCPICGYKNKRLRFSEEPRLTIYPPADMERVLGKEATHKYFMEANYGPLIGRNAKEFLVEESKKKINAHVCGHPAEGRLPSAMLGDTECKVCGRKSKFHVNGKLHVGNKVINVPGIDFGPTPNRNGDVFDIDGINHVNCVEGEHYDVHYVPFVGIDFGAPERSKTIITQVPTNTHTMTEAGKSAGIEPAIKLPLSREAIRDGMQRNRGTTRGGKDVDLGPCRLGDFSTDLPLPPHCTPKVMYKGKVIRVRTLSAAHDAMKAFLGVDPDLAWTWHCNIACCAMDEGMDHDKAQRVAERFMKLAFDVDTSEGAPK